MSAKTWEKPKSEHGSVVAGPALVSCLKRLTEVLLVSWLQHSHTLRLSVLEKVNDRRAWNRLVEFIERYGQDLFTQRFLSLGNLRAILHQGVDAWLRKLEEFNPEGLQFRLLEDLDNRIPRKEAVERLTLVLEAVVENYGEYRDYNSTTTQSDRGRTAVLAAGLLATASQLRSDLLEPAADCGRSRNPGSPRLQASRSAMAARPAGADQGRSRQVPRKTDDAPEKVFDADADRHRPNQRTIRATAGRRPHSALVPCAVAEAQRTGPHPTFRLLQYETEFLMRQPSGVGFDVPAWLTAVDEEVQRTRLPAYERNEIDDLCSAVGPLTLSCDDIRGQIDSWAAR